MVKTGKATSFCQSEFNSVYMASISDRNPEMLPPLGGNLTPTKQDYPSSTNKLSHIIMAIISTPVIKLVAGTPKGIWSSPLFSEWNVILASLNRDWDHSANVEDMVIAIRGFIHCEMSVCQAPRMRHLILNIPFFISEDWGLGKTHHFSMVMWTGN